MASTLLFAIAVSVAAPALAPAPAHAAEAARVETVTNVPWQKVGQWILKNALTLLMLAEEIVRDLQGGDTNPPPETPPQPSATAAGES